ncbi:unnamed protein product [Vicia faba]|uniref:Uncharacterized protein n=1 Tax=Vicia faba TaxID=3906 RepID=A0AAV0ZEG0_VICFA|nr:unnamed protein product [Vicia faba]
MALSLHIHIHKNLTHPNPICNLHRKHISLSKPFFLPPTFILVSLPSDNSHQVLATPTPSSPTNVPKWVGHGKLPPLEPPPLEDTGYFKVAFMVFVDMPQRCLDVVYVFLSENLLMVVAEKNLLSSQQMTPS